MVSRVCSKASDLHHCDPDLCTIRRRFGARLLGSFLFHDLAATSSKPATLSSVEIAAVRESQNWESAAIYKAEVGPSTSLIDQAG